MKVDEKALKSHSIYWDKDDQSLVGISNDLMGYLIKLRKEFNSYQQIPDEYQIEVCDLVMRDEQTLTVDVNRKRKVKIKSLTPEIIPISIIDFN